MNSVRVLSAALLGLLLPLFLHAAEEGDYSRGMVDRAAALARAAECTVAKYPDAEEVRVADLERIRYEPDGTYVQWQESYVKILTEEGRRGYRTISSYFTIPYQRGPEDCRVVRVELIKGDGTVVPIDVEKQSRVMVNPGDMSNNIYNPNDKLIEVSLAGVEVGDVVHYIMFDRVVQARMKDSWADVFLFEGTEPILGSVVEVSAPPDRPLRGIALKSPVGSTVAYTQRADGDRVLHRWEAREVPRMFPEPNMPPLYSCVQRLYLSTSPDWAAVSRWYWNLSEPHLKMTPEMRAKVAELTNGIARAELRMRPLFEFVAQQVRYMGITVEATAPGYEPHDAADTFNARHGVCRDKAALLVAMLREAGFEAFPTLIHSGPKKDEDVALPYFNHAIVAVRTAADLYQLMDPTDETSAEYLPAYLSDKSYLVATPEGDRLRTSAVDPAEKNLLRIQTVGRLRPDGGLALDTRLVFAGINDNAYRQSFANSRPEDRRRFIESVVRGALPDAVLRDLEVQPENLMDVATPLAVRVTYEAPGALVRSGGSALLPAPVIGARLGMVNHIIGRTGLKERKYPLQTEVACGVTEEIRIALAPGLSGPAMLPQYPAVSTGGLAWEFTAGVATNELRLRSDFRLKAVEYSPADYLQLKDVLKQMERAAREVPVFQAGAEAPEPGGETLCLEDRVEYDLKNDHTWTETATVRKKILTYAGLKQNSELKISFNTEWESVRLERGSVTSPDGTVHEISAKETNLMDAPWVGGAPRYPPERILVASFPSVAIGSTIEYRLVRECRERPFFSLRNSFRGLDPIEARSVAVRAPSGVALRDRARAPGGVTLKAGRTPGGGQRLEWSAGPAGAVRREESLPPWWSFNPTLFLSLGDWRAYGRRVESALLAAAAGQRAAEARARDLVAGTADPWEKLRLIRDFVAVSVREVGPGLSALPLTAVTPADRTLAEGYGNTTDRAILLHAMLSAAGFRPRFVLASGLRRIPELEKPLRESPATDVFDAVLVEVRDRALRLPREQAVYLNDTDQYAAIGASPHAGCLALEPHSGEFTGVSPYRNDAAETVYRVALDPDGNARMTRRLLLSGNAFGREKQRYAEMTPEERRRQFQEMVADVSEAAEADGELHTDFTGYPGVVEFSVSIPRYAARRGGYLSFMTPESLRGALPIVSGSRNLPLQLNAVQTVSMEFQLSIPKGFRVEHAPEAFELPGVAGTPVSARRTRAEAAEGTGLTSRTELVLGPAVVEPDRYPELLDLDRRLSRKPSRMVLLKTEAAGAAGAGGE